MADSYPLSSRAGPDWAGLAQLLLDEFPEISVADVLRELRRAKEAVEVASLDPDDSIVTALAITRQQILLLLGRAPDSARLDPERHVRNGPASVDIEL